MPDLAPDMQIITDVPYKSGRLSTHEAERCLLDLHLPRSCRDFPTLLWFHGGGLTLGDKAMGTTPRLPLALARHGVATVSANYRLAPAARFPAYAEDAAAAFAWVKRHIAEHGGHPDRVFLSGHSAGGYLAALIGFDERYLAAHQLDLRDIAGLFIVSPQVFTHSTVRRERGVGSPQTTPVIDDAAPCHHVRADAPPLFIAIGDRDIPSRVEENRYFIAMLEHLHHPSARLRVIEDRDHTSIVDRMADPTDPTHAALVDFIDHCSETIPIVAQAEMAKARRAILAEDGECTYGELLKLTARAATLLLGDRADLDEARVAFLVPPSLAHVVTQWATWRAGGVAVPLCLQHPAPELAHVIDDSQASILIAHPSVVALLRPLAEARGLPLLTTDELMRSPSEGPLPRVSPRRRAMLIYTSGTTSRPKGVVSTHDMITAQVTSLIEAWGWSGDDHILHVLPLHHVHGVVNVLCCAMWAGATCEILPKFEATAVWDRLMHSKGLTLFMAVPTIYARLIAAWEAADPATRQAMSAGCQRLRLMVSGSAALPVSTLETWRRISNHTLLERYGMTEIGMGLSNPLHGERIPASVGSPLPGVEVRLVDEHNVQVPDDTPGQIQVRGPGVFSEYWRRPDATAEAFTPDGWFKTGDVAVCNNHRYRILGRDSIDIIKSGGYKISALDIEEVLRTHPSIHDCAVVGVEDAEWGQRVAAAVVLKPGQSLDLPSLRTWAKQRLAAYKAPSLLLLLPDLPRNAMGKVTKPDVVQRFAPQTASAG